MIADNIGYSDKYRTLKDSEFIRGRVPMTKEAVRILAAAELEIKPTDVVYDIGAGTGAASCILQMESLKGSGREWRTAHILLPIQRWHRRE